MDAVPWQVCLSDLNYDAAEQAAVAAVLRSKWLSIGDVTREFERRFAALLGVRHVFLVANGTAALHLANLAVGVGPGDEVLTPSMTFVASANATAYCGARPVFADIVGPTDLNVAAADLEARITPRTKAITVVHYAGYAADLDAIMALARERRLRVIEDAAHAPGASLGGRALGTIGDVGCFSFFSNKNLATGEGGAVVTNDDGLAEEIRLLRSHGMTTLSYDRHRGRASTYDVVRLGYNYRATELTAALGCAQLDKLAAGNARRGALTARYREALRRCAGVVVPFAQARGAPSFHIMPILLPAGVDRGAVMAAMRDARVQTSMHYPPAHRFAIYRAADGAPAPELPRTDAAAARQLTLPLHPTMSDADVDLVVEALDGSLARASAAA
jgi:dTDP-4-amino-4,6-dideoxygalactose transaminase